MPCTRVTMTIWRENVQFRHHALYIDVTELSRCNRAKYLISVTLHRISPIIFLDSVFIIRLYREAYSGSGSGSNSAPVASSSSSDECWLNSQQICASSSKARSHQIHRRESTERHLK